MALRFVAALCVFSLLFMTSHSSVVMAGGPPVAAPPVCAPPTCVPPSCAPPTCGPAGGGPFTLCGNLLGMCTNICGAVIGIPAAIMGGLLAPAPKRLAPRPMCAPPSCAPMVCAPPMCPPQVCAPPVCAPPVCAPSRITKCKPYASQMTPQRPLVRYQAPSYYVPASYGPVSRANEENSMNGSISQTVALFPQFLDMPFKLVSGSLQGSGLYNVSFALSPTVGAKASQALW